jgi:hypothetical protein
MIAFSLLILFFFVFASKKRKKITGKKYYYLNRIPVCLNLKKKGCKIIT